MSSNLIFIPFAAGDFPLRQLEVREMPNLVPQYLTSHTAESNTIKRHWIPKTFEEKVSEFSNHSWASCLCMLILMVCWNEWEQIATLKVTMTSDSAPFASLCGRVLYFGILHLSCSSVNGECWSERRNLALFESVGSRGQKSLWKLEQKQSKTFSLTTVVTTVSKAAYMIFYDWTLPPRNAPLSWTAFNLFSDKLLNFSSSGLFR